MPRSDPSLEELQRLFAEGDGEALAGLLRRHEPHLRACALRWAGGHQASAEEGYGDFTVHLSRARAKGPSAAGAYRANQPWLPWAKTLLRNAVYSQLRANRARHEREREKVPLDPADLDAALAAAVWDVFRSVIESGGANGNPSARSAWEDAAALSPESRELVARFRVALRECLGQLKTEDQQRLAACFWSRRKANDYEGIASTAIRKRLQRAREELRQCVTSKVPGVGHE
jgi:RNA polymerase sigma factor (sigma-70 family)